MMKRTFARTVTPSEDKLRMHELGENSPETLSLGKLGAAREARIAEIRSGLVNGSYRIASDQIATKLLERIPQAKPQ